jgi:hypothetical protein
MKLERIRSSAFIEAAMPDMAQSTKISLIRGLSEERLRLRG